MRNLKTHIENIMEFGTHLEQAGYLFYLGGIRGKDDMDYLTLEDELDEGFVLSEYELVLSTKNGGEMVCYTNIKDKEFLTQMLLNHDIAHEWLSHDEVVIWLYIGEIKEYIKHLCEYTNINKNKVLDILSGSIIHERTEYILALEKDDDDNWFFVVLDDKNKIAEYHGYVNDITDVLYADREIQRRLNLPSYIMGICQTKKLSSEEYKNVMNNVINKSIRE